MTWDLRVSIVKRIDVMWDNFMVSYLILMLYHELKTNTDNLERECRKTPFYLWWGQNLEMILSNNLELLSLQI